MTAGLPPMFTKKKIALSFRTWQKGRPFHDFGQGDLLGTRGCALGALLVLYFLNSFYEIPAPLSPSSLLCPVQQLQSQIQWFAPPQNSKSGLDHQRMGGLSISYEAPHQMGSPTLIRYQAYTDIQISRHQDTQIFRYPGSQIPGVRY